jgi:thiol-disulfide isomerase/thioredoxin
MFNQKSHPYPKTLLFTILLVLLSCKRMDANKYMSHELYDWNGNVQKLENYKGKVIVLEFWATWCEPCKKAAPIVDRVRKKADAQKTVFWGINTDEGKTLEELKETAKTFGMRYDSLLDPNMEFSDILKVDGLPALLFLDMDGRVFHKQYGVSERDYPELIRMLKELEKD